MSKRKITFNRPCYMRIYMIGIWNKLHRRCKVISWEYRYNKIRKEFKRRKFGGGQNAN